MTTTYQRSVLVTGGASGIGLAIARGFASQGSRVLLADVSESVHEVASSLSSPGAIVQGHRADLSQESEVLGTANAVKERLDGCDVVVNCAGVSTKRGGRPVAPHDLTTAEWQRVLFVNLTAPFLLCRELIPEMQAKQFGRIINITSRAGRTFVSPAPVDYSASKAGLIGLTRQLAGVYASHGITVNAIAPGRIETPMSRQSSAEVVAAALKAIPAERVGTTDEVASLALYLASEAAAYITGACIDMNGGAFMGG